MKFIYLIIILITGVFAKGSSGRSSSRSRSSSSRSSSSRHGYTKSGYLTSKIYVSYYSERGSEYYIRSYPWYPWIYLHREYQSDSVCSDDQINSTINCFITNNVTQLNSTDCYNTPSTIVQIVDTCFPKCNSTFLDDQFINITSDMSINLNQTCNITIDHILSNVISYSYDDYAGTIILSIFMTFIGIICCVTVCKKSRNI
jgi:hypothetical protein